MDLSFQLPINLKTFLINFCVWTFSKLMFWPLQLTWFIKGYERETVYINKNPTHRGVHTPRHRKRTENSLKCRLSWGVYKAFPHRSSHYTPSTSFRVNPGKPYGSQIGFIKSSRIVEEALIIKQLSNGCFSTCNFSEVTTLGIHHTERFKCHQRDIPSRSKC